MNCLHNEIIASMAAANLAADAEGLEGVEAEPARVAGLREAVHELGVQHPLQGGQPNQDHMLLLGRQLVPQDVVATSWNKNNGFVHSFSFVCLFVC